MLGESGCPLETPLSYFGGSFAISHHTLNDTSTDMAVEYAGLGTVEDAGVPEIKLDSVLRDAERLVKRCATPPDTPTEEYTVAASDAEMRVFDYLVNTEGYLSSSGITGISEGYVDFEKVEEIVRYALSEVSGGSNPKKLRSFPIARG